MPRLSAVERSGFVDSSELSRTCRRLRSPRNGLRARATAIWDANRYNETESPSPRYTFGQMRIDAMGGHLTLDTESKIRLKPLGQPGLDVEYPHENINFAADCVYTLQRHFVECMQSGGEFESTGEDYLKTLRVADAVYESARLRQAVKL